MMDQYDLAMMAYYEVKGFTRVTCTENWDYTGGKEIRGDLGGENYHLDHYFYTTGDDILDIIINHKIDITFDEDGDCISFWWPGAAQGLTHFSFDHNDDQDVTFKYGVIIAATEVLKLKAAEKARVEAALKSKAEAINQGEVVADMQAGVSPSA